MDRRAIRISSPVFIRAKLMVTKLVHGTIAVVLTTHAAIHKVSTIHGECTRSQCHFTVQLISNDQTTILTIFSACFCRCFVGEGPDQWRTCSDRYYPLSTSGNSPISTDTANVNATSNKKKTSPISYTSSTASASNKRKDQENTNDSYHQQPPRPGGLQNLEEIASARLWPITYLYSSGPPNSTDLSNFVDCNKESC